MSWPYEEIFFGQSLELPGKKRTIYDTTLRGHGNAGHTFGDNLTTTERFAVIEYLKTL